MTSDQIIERLGGTSEVGRLCDCTPQAVSQWMGLDASGDQREIPKARLMYLKLLRPEVFRVDWEKGAPVRADKQGV